MISITEEISALKNQEQALYTSLDNLRGQRSKVKEHRQLDKELAGLVRKRQNYESLARFTIGMPVNRADSKLLGHVCELKITPGGLGEVWVSWNGKVQIPESANLLQPDECAITQIISVGDRVIINGSHESSGETFTVMRLLARGTVETTDENVFERGEWKKVEAFKEIATNEDEEPTNSTNTISITPEMEVVEEAKSVVTIENLTVTVEINELTEDEEQERHRLESKVEKAFYEAGIALRQLRDGRLYRSTHKTFEEYCRDRFGFTRMAAHLKIAAATIWENLYTNGIQTLPSSERQVRELTTLKAEQQTVVWQQAVEEADGKVPSGRIVKGIVERLKERPLFKASDFCSVGDVFTLTRLEGAERKYNGCWAIARELRDFTIAVDVYDTTFAVKPDNLNPIDLPDVRRQLPQTLKRIKRLRDCGMLDRCVYHFLEGVGRQIYLTDLESDLLTFMEQRYGIDD